MTSFLYPSCLTVNRADDERRWESGPQVQTVSESPHQTRTMADSSAATSRDAQTRGAFLDAIISFNAFSTSGFSRGGSRNETYSFVSLGRSGLAPATHVSREKTPCVNRPSYAVPLKLS